MRLFFFFSSRRRHTRCSRDWSSDVCSSDLRAPGPTLRGSAAQAAEYLRGVRAEIGRASCRERVEISVVAVSLKKKKNKEKRIHKNLDTSTENKPTNDHKLGPH